MSVGYNGEAGTRDASPLTQLRGAEPAAGSPGRAEVWRRGKDDSGRSLGFNTCAIEGAYAMHKCNTRLPGDVKGRGCCHRWRNK